MTRTALMGFIMVLAGISPAHARDVNSVLDVGSVRSGVRIEREGEPVALASYAVPVRFAAVRSGIDVGRVLLDPRYRPPKPNPRADDFSMTFRVRPRGGSALAGVGLCRWNASRTVAACTMNNRGGTYRLVVGKRGTELRTSRFVLRMSRSAGRDGFYIGQDDREPDASILIRPAGARAFDVPLKFR